MARKVRDGKLESRSARLKLKIRQKPYTGPSLERGVALLPAQQDSWQLGGQGLQWPRCLLDQGYRGCR